jgi:transcriptional regulator with XRE-family HTH domain
MEAFNAAAFSKRMRKLREARDMTLQEVADASGITKSHVWEMEQGRSVNPSVNAIWGLARALAVSPAALLGMNTDELSLHPVALKVAGMVDRELRANGRKT